VTTGGVHAYRCRIGGVCLGAFAVWYYAHPSSPSASQVEPLLRTYLESTSPCGGTIDNQVDNVSIGPYASQMGGWPVYANHVEECHGKVAGFDNNSLTTTYYGSHDAEKKVAAAFVRRSMSGQLELYEPEIYQGAQREMQQTLEHAVDSVKVN
jgi:hypothetical protein